MVIRSEDNFIWCSNYDVERAQIKTAIGYLPKQLVNGWPKQKVALVTMFDRLGIRIAKDLRESRELIFLSERVFPRNGVTEEDEIYKHFVFVVLHEIAHIFLDHPQVVAEKDRDGYEDAAHAKAKGWYDEHAKEIGLPKLDLEVMKLINDQIDVEFQDAVRNVRRKMSPVKNAEDA